MTSHRTPLALRRGLRTGVALAAISVLSHAALGATPVRVVGSTTLLPLFEQWERILPGSGPAGFEIDARGSKYAPPALMYGQADLGLMSRPLSARELEQWRGNLGYDPTAIRVALDAIAVFVHPNNPVKTLTIDQLTEIYTRAEPRWGDVGVTDAAWRDLPIERVSRDFTSGTYDVFVEATAGNVPFHGNVRFVESSADVIAAVAASPAAIGYESVGLADPSVRAVGLARSAGQAGSTPTFESVAGGAYPLGRHMYLYVNLPPGEKLPAAIWELTKVVCSTEGQEVVERAGYIPLPLRFCRTDLVPLSP